MRFEALQDVKRRLTEANLRLVVSFAKRYRDTTMSFLNGIQEGNIGLMKAVDMFQLQTWVQVLDVRRVVDPPRHYARDCRIGSDHPATRAQGGINESHRSRRRRSYACSAATPRLRKSRLTHA